MFNVNTKVIYYSFLLCFVLKNTAMEYQHTDIPSSEPKIQSTPTTFNTLSTLKDLCREKIMYEYHGYQKDLNVLPAELVSYLKDPLYAFTIAQAITASYTFNPIDHKSIVTTHFSNTTPYSLLFIARSKKFKKGVILNKKLITSHTQSYFEINKTALPIDADEKIDIAVFVRDKIQRVCITNSTITLQKSPTFNTFSTLYEEKVLPYFTINNDTLKPLMITVEFEESFEPFKQIGPMLFSYIFPQQKVPIYNYNHPSKCKMLVRELLYVVPNPVILENVSIQELHNKTFEISLTQNNITQEYSIHCTELAPHTA